VDGIRRRRRRYGKVFELCRAVGQGSDLVVCARKPVGAGVCPGKGDAGRPNRTSVHGGYTGRGVDLDRRSSKVAAIITPKHHKVYKAIKKLVVIVPAFSYNGASRICLEGKTMARRRQWERLKFDTEEEVIRAIGMRAALDGVTQAEVINAALRAYLGPEIAKARERIRGDGTAEVEAGVPGPRGKRDRSGG
jgi:hypothetical protein